MAASCLGLCGEPQCCQGWQPLGNGVRKLGSEPCIPLPAPCFPPNLSPSTPSTQQGMDSFCTAARALLSPRAQSLLRWRGSDHKTGPAPGAFAGLGEDAGYWRMRDSSPCPQGWSLLPGEHPAAVTVGICLPTLPTCLNLPQGHPPPHCIPLRTGLSTPARPGDAQHITHPPRAWGMEIRHPATEEIHFY